jgi:alkylhydroperoxidase family enzyme
VTLEVRTVARISVPENFAHDPASYAFAAFAPSMSQARLALSTAVYRDAIISLREFEAARARIAVINGCEICKKFRSAQDVPGYIDGFGTGDGSSVADRGGPAPDEQFYAELEGWRDSTLYSERERLAIELAEAFSLAPKSLDDDEDFWKRMNTAYSDEELFSLMLSIGTWVGGGRTLHMLQFDNVCGVVPPPPSKIDLGVVAASSVS